MRHWRGYGWITGLALVMSLVIGGSKAAFADSEEVDVALVLAVDISYSMDMEEQKLQREGYIAALNSDEVQRAIRMGMTGRIAITYFEWANRNDQRLVLPWTILDGPEATRTATDIIAMTPIRRAQRTSISGALHYSHKLLREMPYRAMRRVVDVSGDGPNNAGEPVETARDTLINQGVTINGLPVMLTRAYGGWGHIDHLDRYYQDCVIGGPGAFVQSIRSMDEFLTATRQKILREIAENGSVAPAMGEARVQFAQFQSEPGDERTNRSDCMIGERMMRDRWDN